MQVCSLFIESFNVIFKTIILKTNIFFVNIEIVTD